MIDIAYESFVHEICMEAAGKAATSQQRKILKEVADQTGIYKNLKNMKTNLQKTIKQDNTKEAIKIVEDVAKSCREYVPLMSQRLGDLKKIHATVGDAVATHTEVAKKAMKGNFGAVLNLSGDKALVPRTKKYIKTVEHVEKYWCPLILEELRTNGCSEKAFAMATQFYRGNNKFHG